MNVLLPQGPSLALVQGESEYKAPGRVTSAGSAWRFFRVASKHSVIFGKFKYTGTRRLLTVQKGSRQIFLKNNNNKKNY